jgi:superfamily II DNA or RNA helicase
LPVSPADDSTVGLSHVVDLQSMDEDRLGEMLSVVWELEVGNSITPAQGLPDRITDQGFDDPVTLAGFIDAMRWGAVTSADPNRYQAPFWSGVNVNAYQLEPLHRALSSPRANLLLADDVGLGKTIEAGLVVQELLLRHRARTVVIVCPPSLSMKWADEMRDKFGLGFVIVNSELMSSIRRSHGLNANPFTLFPRVIVSMAWLPQNRAQRLLRPVYAEVDNPKSGRRFAFDILIVDEAHHVAPSSPLTVAQGRGYATDTNRTVEVRRLAERCEHRLFLSATPHNGHPESFMALMEMIDPQRFSRGALLDSVALKDVMVRNLKRDLTDKGFKRRQVKSLVFTPSDQEQVMFSALDEIVRASAKLNDAKPGSDIVTMLLKKRFMSSPYAFGQTLARYMNSRDGSGLIDDDYDDILGEGQSDEEEGLWEQDESEYLKMSKRSGSDPLRSATREQLEQLRDWGLGYESKTDSRAEALLGFLDSVCRPDGKMWTNERVVVFTEYAHTVDWLARILRQRDYTDRMAVIQGSTPTGKQPGERGYIREQFTENPVEQPVRVLLATDAAGEGIDLQDYCHRLVNFDIPFNPSRLEQRIGRIDRYGQTQAPLVFHFLPDQTSSTYAADTAFMGGIARKIANVEQDLGSTNEVIADQIQRHFTGGKVPTKPKARGNNSNDVINQNLASGLELNARLTELEQGYDESRSQIHLEPDNLRRVVDTALRINNQLPLVPIADPFIPYDPDGDVKPADTQVFEVPNLTLGWQVALRGLDIVLKPGERRPITFDPAAMEIREPDGAGGVTVRRRNDLAYVHLGHPLVQKAQRLLRRSLWNVGSSLNRVTAVVVDDLPESFVAAVTRMVLVGRGGVRLHEDVFLAGVRLHGRRVMDEDKAEGALDQALDTGNLALADERVRQQIAAMWNAPDAPIKARLESRIQTLAARKHKAVQSLLDKRHESDVKRAHDIFAAFRENLRQSLRQLEDAQAEEEARLFLDPDQQRQRRRDMEAMSRRLDELASEEDREITAINERYTQPEPNTTAAALVFALTRADAEGWID